MSDVVEQPVEEAAVAAPVVADEAQAETPETVERDVDADTLEIPDSSQEGGKARYVPVSALSGARGEIRTLKAELETAKAGSAKATQLEQQIAALSQQVSQMTPYVQAYHAAAQQQQPVAEDDTDAIELARTLDLYTPEGKPDLDKAKKTQALINKLAGHQVQAAVAPMQQQSLAQRSQHNLNRALNTEVRGRKPDPAITRALWARLDPAVTANEEQAKLLVIQALGMGVLQDDGAPAPAPRTASGQFTKATTEEIPPPLHVERAGGKDTTHNDSPLSDAEKAFAKSAGLTDKEYLERSRTMPGYRR
jgi:hypothetical protein